MTADAKTSVVAEAPGEPDKAKAAAPDAEGKEEKLEAMAHPEVPVEQPAGQEGEPPRDDTLGPAATPRHPVLTPRCLQGQALPSRRIPRPTFPGSRSHRRVQWAAAASQPRTLPGQEVCWSIGLG